MHFDNIFCITIIGLIILTVYDVFSFSMSFGIRHGEAKWLHEVIIEVQNTYPLFTFHALHKSILDIILQNKSPHLSYSFEFRIKQENYIAKFQSKLFRCMNAAHRGSSLKNKKVNAG